MGLLRPWTAFFIFLYWMLSSGIGRAQSEGPTVVSVVYSEHASTAVRIAAELSSAGFSPVLRQEALTVSSDALKSIVETDGAAAVMRLSPAGDSVQVWVVQPDEAVTVLQEVPAPAASEEKDVLLAFKAVELLRARLMPLPAPVPTEPPVPKKKSPPVSKPVPPPPEPAPPKPPPGVPRLAVRIAPASVYGFGNMPWVLNIDLALCVRIAPQIVLFIDGLIPTFPMEVTVPEGSIRASDGIVTAGIELFLRPTFRRVLPSISVFGGMLILNAEAHADSGFTGESVLFTAGAFGGTAALRIRINEFVAFKAAVSAGVGEPLPVLGVLNRKAFSYGRPLLIVVSGLEVRLW